MSKAKKKLRKLSIAQVKAFKIANRRGVATIVKNNLTEGRSLVQAYSRLVKACKRSGYELPANRLPRITNIG